MHICRFHTHNLGPFVFAGDVGKCGAEEGALSDGHGVADGVDETCKGEFEASEGAGDAAIIGRAGGGRRGAGVIKGRVPVE